MDRQTGRIKFFNSSKGYGFIKADDGTEYFYHISGLSDENYRPQADERVKFDVQDGKRGLKAVDVEHCR